MTATQLSSNSQLLLCCACADASAIEKNAAHIRQLLSASIDWKLLRAMASRHNCAPLLFWNLQTFSGEIPPEILRDLRADFDGNVARNFFLTTQLLETLARFESQKILALAYKGPALSIVAYGNILSRSFCDLDLLLPRADVARAGVLLARNGFVQNSHAGAARNDYAQQWRRESGNVVVELHWDIALRHQAPPLDFRSLWRAPMSLEIGGANIFAPALDDLFLLLAWHGYKHRWSVLEWSAAFAGCARNAEKENFDWPSLWEKACRSGSLRVLMVAFCLTHELFNAPLPRGVQEIVERDFSARKLAREISQMLLCDLNGEANIEGAAWYHLRSRERLRDKARYLWRLASAPGEMDWRLGREIET